MEATLQTVAAQPVQFVPRQAPTLGLRGAPATLTTSCSTCHLKDICLPCGLTGSDVQRLDSLKFARRRVKEGEELYHEGDRFQFIYAVRSGTFKSVLNLKDGREQVTGFQMAGELLGMDAISTDRHHCNAVALEDSEVCEIPFSRLESLFGDMPTLLHHFHRMMSQEITREQSVMLLLGNMRAEQRFAAFLVNLASRYSVRGYSSTSFQLRMTREEIGNYLGLTIESISRLLSKFKKQGWIKVANRELELLDPVTLKAVAAGTQTCN